MNLRNLGYMKIYHTIWKGGKIKIGLQKAFLIFLLKNPIQRTVINREHLLIVYSSRSTPYVFVRYLVILRERKSVLPPNLWQCAGFGKIPYF